MPSHFKNSKKAHEFIGLCLGVLADNRLVKEEVEFLRDWLRRHPRVAGSYPAKGLFIRICEMLEDEVIDDEEEKELFEHLYELTGSGPKGSKKKKSGLEKLAEVVGKPQFTDPCPPIKFENNSFFLHGNFIIGMGAWLQTLITEKGGTWTDQINAETDYCIIGAMAELDTAISPELCSQLNNFSSQGLKIVSEENWVNHLFD
jgi:hypothetical protein